MASTSEADPLAYTDEDARFFSRIQLLDSYPHLPRSSIDKILSFSLGKGSDFGGDSGTLDDPSKTRQAVQAYIRYNMTDYSALLSDYRTKHGKAQSRRLATRAVEDKIEKTTDNWRSGIPYDEDVLMGGITEGRDEEEGIASTTSMQGYRRSPIELTSSGPTGMPLQDSAMLPPSLEEAQEAARLKKPLVSAWHTMKLAPKKQAPKTLTHIPGAKVSKSIPHPCLTLDAGKLEYAFSRLKLNPIAQTVTANTYDTITEAMAQPGMQIEGPAAETAAPGSQDGIANHHSDAQMADVRPTQAMSSDPTSFNRSLAKQASSVTRSGSRFKSRRRDQPNPNLRSQLGSAEANLRALREAPHRNVERIARAYERVVTLRLELERADRKLQKAAQRDAKTMQVSDR